MGAKSFGAKAVQKDQQTDKTDGTPGATRNLFSEHFISILCDIKVHETWEK